MIVPGFAFCVDGSVLTSAYRLQTMIVPYSGSRLFQHLHWLRVQPPFRLAGKETSCICPSQRSRNFLIHCSKPDLNAGSNKSGMQGYMKER